MTNEEFIESIRLKGEIWKDIPGFKNWYIISNYGRIAGLNRIVKTWNGERPVKPTLLKVKPQKSGYIQVVLQKEGFTKTFLVHRLVALVFLSNPENKPCVDHIDRNRSNNNISNLRWCTLSENMNNPNTIEHCRSIRVGFKNPTVWIPVVSLLNGKVVKQYKSIHEAVLEGYNSSSISNICSGRRKTHKGLQWMYLSDYEKLVSKPQQLSLFD